MWRLACSVALRIASGTSRALPAPWPTRPLPSRSPPRSRRSPLSLRAILRPLLEGQAALTGGVGQGFHPAMKQIRTTVEDDFPNAGGDRTLGKQFAHGLGRVDIRAGLQARLQRLVDSRGGGQRQALLVVDDLGVDMQA